MSDERLTSLTANKEAQQIIAVLDQKGFETRFIGGCVRDALLGRLTNDIDLASTALPQEMIDCLEKENIRTFPTGIDHGTITALLSDKTFEITTLRKDVDTDGRHATVEFTNDWLEDAGRRDFTINALSVNKDGCLFDYFGGLEDLQHKKLKFIGDAKQRIQEDYLRILRYFRFASTLDWQIDDQATLQICSDLAPKISSLSCERIQVELTKLLLGTGSLRVMRLIKEYHILSALIDKIDIDQFEKMILSENQHQQEDAFRRLMALFGKDEATLAKLMVLSKNQKKRLETFAKISDNEKLPALLYRYGQEAVLDFYFLDQPDWDFSIIKNWEKPVFPLKAEDIFHLTDGPGPKVGQLLATAENHWIAHDFKPLKQELLTFLK